jgi:predicted transcriptional regulator
MKEPRLPKPEPAFWSSTGDSGPRPYARVLESLPEDELVAYTTVQTLVYRLEQKGALRKVKKIGNAQLFQPALNQSRYRSRLVRDLQDLSAARRVCSSLICSRMVPLPYAT